MLTEPAFFMIYFLFAMLNEAIIQSDIASCVSVLIGKKQNGLSVFRAVVLHTPMALSQVTTW